MTAEQAKTLRISFIQDSLKQVFGSIKTEASLGHNHVELPNNLTSDQIYYLRSIGYGIDKVKDSIIINW